MMIEKIFISEIVNDAMIHGDLDKAQIIEGVNVRNISFLYISFLKNK